MIRKKKLKLSQFRSQVSADEFAGELDALPGIADAMRAAGLRDGAMLSAARAHSAARAELRARALGRSGDQEKAARRKTEAAVLARALKRESDRTTPEEAVLGKIDANQGTCRVVGKVTDATGNPAAGLDVTIAGITTKRTRKATTDKNGVFDISLPVGAGGNRFTDGEGLVYDVAKGTKRLARTRTPVAEVAVDKVARIRIALSKKAGGGVINRDRRVVIGDVRRIDDVLGPEFIRRRP